jgi:hypothetical protein
LNINEFLEQSHLVQATLAQAAGTTQKTISELANRVGTTTLPVACRIEEATLGLVTAEEVPLHPDDSAALRYLRPNGPPKRRSP